MLRSPHRNVAVLYQKVAQPVINGNVKPLKPEGYQDSGADIAYNLSRSKATRVTTPTAHPDPNGDSFWCFPDTEQGILSAITAGATHLWANTILFKSHPLQISTLFDKFHDDLYVVGQPPCLLDLYDDKHYVNDLLRSKKTFTMPKGLLISELDAMDQKLIDGDLSFPVVAKPLRGRGSQGVKVCHSLEELVPHVKDLFTTSSSVMIEEYLAGEEATVTVMPPGREQENYWALPVVVRTGHHAGVAPYNGIVAVTANSRAITIEEYENNPTYDKAARECEAAAKLLRVTAPIRIDIRRRLDERSSPFVLFDVNMKPNMTGPGRPGRDDQASLTAMAAAQLGWSYPELLTKILESATTLGELRQRTKLEA